MINPVPLSQCENQAIEKLLDAAFGGDRKSRTAYRLRDGVNVIAPLSFGILDGADLIGSIQCWPTRIMADDGDDVGLILVGPVAIAPGRQNQGHGRALMHAMLNAAMDEANPPLIMVGDPDYYGQFGFTAAHTGGWTLPGPWQPDRLLLRNEGGYILPISGMIGPDTDN